MRRLIFIALMAFGVAGCAGPNPEEAPKIRYGEDVCRQCRMSIDDARFSAAFFDGRGLTQKFDDIGCMKIYSKENQAPPRAWVHDYASGEWLEVREAFFVVSASVTTPMNYGVTAFSSKDEAEKFAARQTGEVFSWEDLDREITTNIQRD